MQWGVCLCVTPAWVWQRTGLEQEVHGLAALRAAGECSAGRRDLQRELAPSVEAEASCIWLGTAVQQQTYSWDICLANGLMESVFPLTHVPALQGCPQQRNGLFIHSGFDLLLQFLCLLPRTRPHWSCNAYSLQRS